MFENLLELESWVDSFFLLAFHNLVLLSSGLHCFRWEISHNSYHHSLAYNCHFPLAAFKTFILGFNILTMMCLVFLVFILHRVCWVFWPISLYFSHNLGNSQLFFQRIVAAPSCCPLLLGSSALNVVRIDRVLQVNVTLSMFLFFFPMFFLSVFQIELLIDTSF